FTIALRMRATTQLSTISERRIGVIGCRIIPVWNGSTFVEQESRSASWAFLDAYTNPVYGAGRDVSRVDFQSLVDLATTETARGDTCNIVFKSTMLATEALDTILAPVRAKSRWAGDIINVFRDEYKSVPQMMLTDQQIVRGSVNITVIMNNDDDSD